MSGSFELYDEFYYEHWGFLMKTDSDGNMLWAVKDSVDFLNENENYAFTETSEGDLICVGYRLTGGGYMIKRDSEGNRLWSITYIDFGVNSMCKTLDGNIALGGRLFANAALRKMDNDGNTIWTKSYEIGSGSNAYSVCQASDGGYLLTGINYTNNDILTIKTDANGDSLWTYTFDGLGYNDKGNCITEGSNGNVFVGGVLAAPSPIYGYGFLASINSEGDTLWTKQFPAIIFSPFLSLVDLQDSIAAYGANYGEAKLLILNYDGEILNESDIYGYRPTGDRCFQKSENGYICLSREGMYNSIIALNKTDDNGVVPVDNHNYSRVVNMDLNCYPNPFNLETSISFNLMKSEKINLSIYNVRGQKVKAIIKEKLGAGEQRIIWNGKDMSNNNVSSGVYLLRLRTQKNEIIKKITKIGE